MLVYKRYRIAGILLVIFFFQISMSRAWEAQVLRPILMFSAIYLFNKADVEARKVLGPDPHQALKRRILGTVFVIAIVGLIIYSQLR